MEFITEIELKVELDNMLKKLLILLLKVIPMILAGLAFANTVLCYFYIDTVALEYIGGTSILTLTFLYMASYVFKFCEYHRMFLHYIVACNLISFIDAHFGLPVGNVEYLMLHSFLMFVSMVITLILFMKKI